MLVQFGIFQTWEDIFYNVFFGHVPLYVVSFSRFLFLEINFNLA